MHIVVGADATVICVPMFMSSLCACGRTALLEEVKHDFVCLCRVDARSATLQPPGVGERLD